MQVACRVQDERRIKDRESKSGDNLDEEKGRGSFGNVAEPVFPGCLCSVHACSGRFNGKGIAPRLWSGNGGVVPLARSELIGIGSSGGLTRDKRAALVFVVHARCNRLHFSAASGPCGGCQTLSDKRKPGARSKAMAAPTFGSPGTACLFPSAVDLLAAAAERSGGGECFGHH